MPREQDDASSGRVTARVVEEGYVSLQDSMRTYRQARNQGHRAAGLPSDADPVILLQDAVETFFELIRPYIKDEPRLSEYWHGGLARHPDEQHDTPGGAVEYYVENSVGIWQTQQHTGAIPAGEQPAQTATGAQGAIADGGVPDSPREWHALLDLPETVRVLRVEPALSDEDFNGWYYQEGRFAIVGLRDVTRWEVRTHTERERGAGFMAGETAASETREPEPAAKVETAARMLIEVADELGAIATYEPAGDRIHGTPIPDS